MKKKLKKIINLKFFIVENQKYLLLTKLSMTCFHKNLDQGKDMDRHFDIICLIGLFAYFLQLKNGLVVTNMGDYVSWGIYISNFVFFVAISLVGSLITAIFRLTNVQWRTPLTRISEMIAVSAITFASMIIIVDMGRPERLINLFTHGRLQSPIMWDVIVIGTYFCISLFLLYITLLPDIKIMIKAKEKMGKPFAKLYKWLGFILERNRGTGKNQ